MFGPVETVKVVSKEHADTGGYKVINKSDFDSKIHKLFDAPPAPVADPFKDMSVVDMKALLDGLNIEYDKNAKADVLRELCRKHTQPNA